MFNFDRLSIGLTGGIGCGKTTVTNMFSSLGVDVIDSDNVSRSILNRIDIKEKLKKHFGIIVFQSNGEIDRRKLREIVFNNQFEKNWLESLLHPEVFADIKQQIKKTKSNYCLVVIPLLFEKNLEACVDRVLVVDADIDLQVGRAATRDNSSEEEIKKIISHQIDRSVRVSLANDVIINNGSLDNLRLQVEKLHAFYSDIASKKSF